MAKDKKTMCEWKRKDIEENLAELIKIVRKPGFVCEKCARVASSKKQLCKPRKIGASA